MRFECEAKVVRASLALSLFLIIGGNAPGNLAVAQTSASLRASRVSAATAARSQAGPVLTTTITFRVYNYAHVHRGTLSSAEEVTSAIFEEAGVGTAWVDCPLSATEAPLYPDCERPMGRTDLVLKIVPHSMEAKLSFRGEALGFAEPCPEGPACEISVFYEQIEDTATSEYRVDRILGHVIAHEAGHVLLGPNAHFPVGIMRGMWSPRDFQLISLGFPLDFTDEQRTQLHADLIARELNRSDEPANMRSGH